MTSSQIRKRFVCVIHSRSVHDKMMSFDVMAKYGISTRAIVFTVQSWIGEKKIIKLNCACYKIKCMKFRSKVIQSLFGFSQLVSFLSIFQESHTTYVDINNCIGPKFLCKQCRHTDTLIGNRSVGRPLR